MATPETPQGTESLMKHKEEIFATKRLFEIHKTDPKLEKEDILALEGIIVKNFTYLTENERLSKDEYYRLFQECESKKDFEQLALLTHKFLIRQLQQYLVDNPDLPEKGSAIEPGKENIESLIAWNEVCEKVLTEVTGEGGKVPIHEIGGPGLHETPEWILDIEELQIHMSEVYALLEKNSSGNNEALPGARDGVKEVRGKIDSL